MVYGVWCMVYGVWCMVYGVWCTVYGVWCTVYGVWCTVYGVRCMVYIWCTHGMRPSSYTPPLSAGPPPSAQGTNGNIIFILIQRMIISQETRQKCWEFEL